MPVYQLDNGLKFESQTPLSDDQVLSAAQSLTGDSANGGGSGQAPQSDNNNNNGPSILGELGRSLEEGGATLGRTAADAGSGLNNFLFNLTGNPSFKSAGTSAKAGAAFFNKWLRDHPSAAPNATDIKNAHDFGMFAAHALGSAPPYVAAALAGSLGGPFGAIALPAVLGGAENADQVGHDTNFDPGAMVVGGALGAATAALPVPFARAGGGSLLRSLLKGTAGGALAGAFQGATANVPGAVASGNIDDALPSTDQIVNSAASNAVLGGSLGAALGRGGEPSASGKVDDAAASRLRLSDAIENKKQELGANLNNVKYGRAGSAESVLESVQNDLAEGMKANRLALNDELDPQQASTLDEMMAKANIQGSLRSARNKLKGNVSEADINRIGNVVGQYKEGRILMDLMRQSNELTNLFREGMKGGVSQFTDALNPLMRSGRESGALANLIHSPRLGVTAGYVLQPHLLIPGIGASLAGRGIDAITGRRSRVARFVRQNSGTAPPIDMTGARSVIEDQATQHVLDQQRQTQDVAEQERLRERQRQMLQQQRVENLPGLGGFHRSLYDQTGILPADASRGMLNLFATGAVTPGEFDAFHNDPQKLMAGNVGNHIFDMLDRMARNGQLERDPQWNRQSPTAGQPQTVGQPMPSVTPNPQPSPVQFSFTPPSGSSSSTDAGIGNPEAYRAQAQGNQARVTAAQARVAASPHTPETKQRLNDAISAIGRTNNRQEAGEIRDAVVQSLTAPHEQAYANQELSPLVTQIRHANPAKAKSLSALVAMLNRGNDDAAASNTDGLLLSPGESVVYRGNDRNLYKYYSALERQHPNKLRVVETGTGDFAVISSEPNTNEEQEAAN